MSNKNDQPFMANKRHNSAKVSYTIDNHQPVLCTIIGSQPLFYMDHDAAFIEEEEALLEAEGFGFLEAELSALNKELKTLEKFSADYLRSTDEFDALFAEARNSITAKTSKSHHKINDLTDILENSRLACEYLNTARTHNVSLCYSRHIADAAYDRHAGIIYINDQLDQPLQVLLATQELRRHHQHRAGALVNPMHFHPDSAILINRSQHADLMASSIRVAWELQLSGYKDAWAYIENSSFADLGRAFTREAYIDFRTVNNGQAMTAVFEAWFLSDRCRMEDRYLIRRMLADDQGLVFDVENPHASLTPAIIAALGEMPYGKNYLASHADTIMSDPIFTDVRDRSNANFLWFIKFERTFRETERDLQPNSVSDASNRFGVSHTAKQDVSDEEKIVTLYDADHKPDPRRLKDSGAIQSAGQNNIVYLRRTPEIASS